MHQFKFITVISLSLYLSACASTSNGVKKLVYGVKSSHEDKVVLALENTTLQTFKCSGSYNIVVVRENANGKTSTIKLPKLLPSVMMQPLEGQKVINEYKVSRGYRSVEYHSDGITCLEQ